MRRGRATGAAQVGGNGSGRSLPCLDGWCADRPVCTAQYSTQYHAQAMQAMLWLVGTALDWAGLGWTGLDWITRRWGKTMMLHLRLP